VGTAAAMFYLAAYAFMNIGAFAVVSHLSGKGERFLSVDDFAGLAVRQPGTAALLTIFLLSLIGVPLTGGFFGKFYIFKAALDSHLVWLTVLGLLNSAVAAYYYLRILVVMYMREPSAKRWRNWSRFRWGCARRWSSPRWARCFWASSPRGCWTSRASRRC
jgi:NADH-quinone oxidoreductase subunit N